MDFLLFSSKDMHGCVRCNSLCLLWKKNFGRYGDLNFMAEKSLIE